MTEGRQLAGKTALITGGSRGLGREMALAFADAGADIVVVSRKQDGCEEVAALVEERGRQAMPYACHVGDWGGLVGLVDAAWDRFGRVDVLVNNAGLSPLAPSSADTSEALFDKVVHVNLKGPFRLSALVGSRMAAGDGGTIVNVSSTASVRPAPSTAPYSAAKAGLNALTVAMAAEYGPTVRVNCIVCGPFHTHATKAWSRSEETAARAADWPLGRVGEPDEVVGAALYFAGEASSFTTGAVLRVDGGTAGVV